MKVNIVGLSALCAGLGVDRWVGRLRPLAPVRPVPYRPSSRVLRPASRVPRPASRSVPPSPVIGPDAAAPAPPVGYSPSNCSCS